MTVVGVVSVRAWEWIVVSVLLAAFACLTAGEAAHQSVTVDEFHLVPQAIALRASGDLDLGYKTPPLLKRWIGLALPPSSVSLPDHRIHGRAAAVGWDPWIFGSRFMLANAMRYDAIFRKARWMMLPIGWALAIAVWWWARSAAGPVAAIASLTLLTFLPEIVAFTSIVSLDLLVTALVVGCLVLLREHLRTGRTWALAASGALFGLGLSAKMSMMTLAPLFALVLARVKGPRRLPRAVALAAIAGASALLALHASYGFDRPLPRFSELDAKSRMFRSIRGLVPAALPVPLPLQWLRAVDGQARDVQEANVSSYLDGEWSEKGWPQYYLLAYLYKWPLPLLLLVPVLAIHPFARRARPRDAAAAPLPRWIEWTLIVGPIVVWGGSFSLAGGLNIGLRYVLPCSVLACVGIGVLVGRLSPRSVTGAIAAALLAATVTVSLAAYPHHLAYFNVLGGGPGGAWRHLVDSNLDWGQELRHLASYAKEQGITRIGLGYFGHVAPELYGLDYYVPDEGPPGEGWYAISSNFIAGYRYVVWDHGRLRQTREDAWAPFRDLQPVANLGGALRIYHLPPARR